MEDKIDLTKYLNAIKKGWIWYAISAVVFLGIAITYCAMKMPQYESYSRMLIESDSDNGASKMGGMASFMRTFSIGGFGSSSVDNEILIVDSYSLKKEMVSRLGLNRTYIERKGLGKSLLYKNTPIILDAPSQLFDTLESAFKVRVELKNGLANIKATKGLLGKVIAEKKDATLPCVFDTPYGKFQVLKTSNYDEKENSTIDVIVQGDALVVGGFSKILTVGYASKKADGIDFEIVDASKERGRDILNTMMSLYNEKRKGRRNETAASEVEFLEGRITLLSKELDEAENKVASFKKDNNLVDIGAEVSVLFQKDKMTDAEMLAISVQRSILETILVQLKNPDKKYTLIPMVESLGEAGASSAIGNYNELILKRMAMSESAKKDNVALKTLTEQIDALRESAIENVNRTLDNLTIKYNSANKENLKSRNRLSTLPQKEQEYVDLLRDKELKNALYMFLLEKRESAMLKLNNNQELGFVYEPAYSAIKPVMTKTYVALGVALALVLLTGTFISIIRFAKK